MQIDNLVIDRGRLENPIVRQINERSKEENLELARRQRDTLELTGITQCYVCDNYNDMKPLKDAGSIRFELSSDLKADMRTTLEKYYRGRMSDDTLAQAYVGYCERTGVSTRSNLLDVYESFLNMSKYAANNVCREKSDDSVYYNDEFINTSEHVKDIARAVSDMIADEMGYSRPDYDEREKNTIYTLDGGLSLKEYWKWLFGKQMSLR